MNLPTWYSTGTVSVESGGTTVTLSGGFWGDDAIMAGDLFCDPAQPLIPPQRVMAVTGNGELELWAPWPGADIADAAYEIRYVGIIERSTAQTRKVLEQLGEVSAYFDVQVDDTAARLALETADNPLRANYRVLVSNIGDGSAAIYSKATSAYGNWTAPAPYSGPVGPLPVVEIGATETLAPGSAATVTPTPIAGGVSLAFGLPTGPGFTFIEGGYDSGTAYAVGGVVRDNGSSWIALQATTGNAPPVYPVTANDWWELVAAKGQDGTGTGDMVGPAAATDGAFAGFDGTSGKLTKELSNTVATSMLNVFATSLKGLVPAPSAGDATAGRILSATGAWIDPPATDTSDLETTVSMLALQVADVSNQALFLGPTGNRVADSFNTLEFVDVAGATGLSTSVLGVLKPTFGGGSTQSIGSGTPTGTSSFTGGFTVFNNAVALTESDIIYEIGVYLTVAQNMIVKLGRVAGSGIFDILVSQNFVHPGGGWANCVLAAPFTVPSGTVNVGVYVAGTSIETISTTRAYKAGDASGAGQSSFTVDTGPTPALRVQKNYSTANLTVRSAAFSAASVPTKMKALLLVKELDAAVAGTDYTLECSRDAGTTWASMPLSEMFTTGGLLYVETAEVDVSGQPSGTSPRWRFKTLNNKNVHLDDNNFYWS